MSMIKVILHFFKMQIKHLSLNTIEFNQPLFSISLKGLDPVNMTFATGKFIAAMIHSQVLIKANIN